MTTALNSALLLSGAFAWLALPLLPALRELKTPSDAKGLAVHQGNAADLKEQILSQPPGQLSELPETCGQVSASSEALANWVRAERQLDVRGLPSHVKGVHAPRLELQAFKTSAMFSADHAVRVAPGFVGQVIQAPYVCVGDAVAATPGDARLEADQMPGATFCPDQAWWYGSGDIVIPRDTTVRGDVVCRAAVTLREGARVEGSIKADGPVRLHPHSEVTGNVVAQAALLGWSSTVRGSVVCEGTVCLTTASSVGSDHRPASVVAQHITLSQGCQVYGAVRARKTLRTEPPSR